MSLSDFCDLVWLELWDDCPAMGDQVKYREAIMDIFYEGKEIPAQRGGKPDLSRPIPKNALDALKQLREQIAAAKPPEE